MIMVSPLDTFQCILGAMLIAIPIKNTIMTPSLSPMNMLSIAFIGAGVCPVTGIPTPCVPTILPWMLPSKTLIIDGIPAIITGQSFAICARGGLILSAPRNKPPIIIAG